MYVGLTLVRTLLAALCLWFPFFAHVHLSLIQTTPSNYQMLRGSVVVFTGLLSWLFLKRKLLLHHWLGMVRSRNHTQSTQ